MYVLDLRISLLHSRTNLLPLTSQCFSSSHHKPFLFTVPQRASAFWCRGEIAPKCQIWRKCMELQTLVILGRSATRLHSRSLCRHQIFRCCFMHMSLRVQRGEARCVSAGGGGCRARVHGTCEVDDHILSGQECNAPRPHSLCRRHITLRCPMYTPL